MEGDQGKIVQVGDKIPYLRRLSYRRYGLIEAYQQSLSSVSEARISFNMGVRSPHDAC